ncbi:MAG: DUF1361 domain-containing protein [Anaerolineales bacterium]|nr:DUF1361 domain-containing protein [Anaerolineales bacterium]
MNTLLTKTLKLHRFLSENLFYPLVLSTILSLGFFIGRVIWSDQATFTFLIWNLFLAWLPYLFSLAALVIHHWQPRWWWAVIPPGAMWLLFFPNAPYILTDLMHLRQRSLPIWYDIGLLLTFALTGCFLGIASLRSMQKIVGAFVGKFLSWLFVLGTMGLTSFGIYLGRYLRWNSWDILTNPIQILRDIYHPIRHPFSNKETIAFSVMFAAILFVFYLTFNWLRPLKDENHAA